MAGTSRIELSDLEFDQSLQALLQTDDFGDANTSRLRVDNAFYGFDNSVGESWIYPVNYPKRAYQYAICKQALFKNTLVVLPTGLGKTFIAAVVMYNIYRWYPKGKVIFMAPARPLVAQQVNACYDIMGIPKEDTTEVTGRQTKKSRHKNWKSKRVFYATPQAVMSDILNPEHNFPVKDIKLVVIDEAHKARGKYAYCEVIRMISETNKAFRVLALTATPGRHIADVKDVVENLRISHIEIRYETSIDVAPYTFKKKIKTEVVKFDDTIKRVRRALIDIITPYLRTLSESNLVNANPESNSKGRLIMLQKDFRHLASIEKPRNYSDICNAFSTCISLYHSLELLERHGVRMFLNSMLDNERENGFKYFVAQNSKIMKLIDALKEEIKCDNISLDNSTLNKKDENFFFGHPKYFVLEQKLLEHFGASDKAKAMIFCEFRETVCLIDILLAKHSPLIRVKKLVGQGSSSSVKAVTQKEQIAVMKEFKAGKCNCLIATCVAEEGIDVGDVDLIVCFDSNTNPTRYIQRIGRTGRKQQGNVLMLVSEGKESETFKQVVDRKDKTNQNITKSREIEWALYKQSPRLVPPQFNPKCLEVFCNVAKEVDADEPSTDTVVNEAPKKGATKKNTRSKKTTTVNKKKDPEPPTGTKDMRHFFKPISIQESSSLNPTISSVFKDQPQVLPDNDIVITQYEPENIMPYNTSDTSITEPVLVYVGNESAAKRNKLNDENKENEIEPDEQWSFLSRIRTELTQRTENNISKVTFGESNLIGDLTNTKISQDLNTKINLWANLCSNIDSKENNERSKKLANGPTINKRHVSANYENLSSVTSKQNSKSFGTEESPIDMSIAGLNPVESRYANIETKVHKNGQYYEEPDLTHIETSLINLEKSIRLIAEEELGNKPQTTISSKDVLSSLGLTSIDDIFNFSSEEMEYEEDLPMFPVTTKKEISDVQVVEDQYIKADSESIKHDSENPKISLEEVVDFENLFGDDDDDDDLLLEVGTNLSAVRKSPTRTYSRASEEEVQCSQEKLIPTVCSGRRNRVTSQVRSSKSPKNELENITEDPEQDAESDYEVSTINLNKQFNPAQMSTPTIESLATKTVSPPSTGQGIKVNLKTSPSLLGSETPRNRFLLKLQQSDIFKSPVKHDGSAVNPTMLPSPITPTRKKFMLPRSLTSPCLSTTTNTTPSQNLSKPVDKADISPYFATQVRPKGMMGMRKRRIMSDSEEEQEEEKNNSPKIKVPKKKVKTHLKKNNFLDMEADVSNHDTDDEEDDDETASQTLDSFVVPHTDSLNDIDPNMYAKYVQSIRSPTTTRGRFKMPAQLKDFNPHEIYSQAVPEVMSQYEVDGSFVVENDAVDEKNSSEDLCQLEIAEMILEAERKQRKRKRKQ